MSLHVAKTNLDEILPLRNLFLQENNVQIRYNACHERGWTDSYVIVCDGEKAGYCAVKGKENLADRDTAFEFYIVPSFRHFASHAFRESLLASKASFIECQSNDLLLTALLYEYGENINADTILFEEGTTTDLKIAEALFRKRHESDVVFEHKTEPGGDYLLVLNDEVVATGGFLLHYNMPFADLYMEVKEGYRRKGFGSFLIQELKKQCYLAGRVPAARTGMDNVASRSTLKKAGLKTAGFMLRGAVRSQL